MLCFQAEGGACRVGNPGFTRIVPWKPIGKNNGYFKNGKLDGLKKQWYENGQLSVEGNFKNGELDGLQRSWYENGQLNYEVNYKNGELIE